LKQIILFTKLLLP